MLPLLATQILWINLVTDGAPALALGVDPADPGADDAAAAPRGEGVHHAAMWRGIVFVGVVMAVGTLLVLDAALPGGLVDGTRRPALRADAGVHDAGVLPALQRLQRALRRAERVHADSSPTAGSGRRSRCRSLLQAAVVYTPFLQHAFETVALGARRLAASASASPARCSGCAS